MTEQDRHIDAYLRDVSAPMDLERRMAADALFADDTLDRVLAEVALPAGLVDRLHARVGGPLPAGRNAGSIDLERIASAAARGGEAADRHRLRFGRWATAIARDGLAVVMALSVAWIVFAVGAELSQRLASLPRGKFAAAAPPRVVTRGVADDAAAAPQEPVGKEPAGVDRRPRPRLAPANVTGNRTGEPAVATLAAGPTAETAAEPASASLPPQVRGAAVGLTGERPADSSAMRLLEPPREAWRLAPRVRGYDLAFEMAHGESPFVDPAMPGLSTDVPPLTLRTDAFDRLAAGVGRPWHAVDRNLRMEHVLAAIPAATAPTGIGPSGDGDVRVDIHCVRSFRSVSGVPSRIVEVAATADRDGSPMAASPLEATIVLDRSAGGDLAIWPRICRGLAAVAGQMSPNDRVTVMVSGPVPRLAVRRGDAVTIAALAAELERLPPMDASDIDAAIRMASTESTTTGSRLVVVAHQETADRGRDVVRAALAGWHEAQASVGGEPLENDSPRPGLARFVLVDPTTSPEERSQGPSFGRTPADATAIRRELVRQVFATETLVGRQCRLTVRFDPRFVAAYRLIGHRQSAMESLAVAAPAAIDLHVGETVRAVYEIVPRAATASAGVSAELDWRGTDDVARTSHGRLAAADLDHPAMLPSPHGCELLLAVTLAETVGGSAHGDPRARTAAAVLVRRWRERGDMPPFGERLAAELERFPASRRP
ncbi:MAG: DUF3520 domain-containing protein [Planctomycetia bacterium]|nr:DUF3520 domain-containing protein [Planctomycetia bacterium]